MINSKKATGANESASQPKRAIPARHRAEDQSISCFCDDAELALQALQRKKRWAAVGVTHVLLGALVVLILMPGQKTVPSVVPFLVVIALIEGLYLSHLVRNFSRAISASWIVIITTVVLALWELFSTKLAVLHPVLVPTPEAVFNVFPTQYRTLLINVGSSVELLCVGALTSIVLGVFLGALIGWVPSIRDVCAPIARILAPIPSVVFAPYLVAIMPTFRSASAMVVFLGLFWPTLLGTIVRVSALDERIVEQARMLELKNFAMVHQIILPYLLPGVINGLNSQLTASIMMLTFAEMLGAKSGMGYYIINYTYFANYTNVIAGIIVVGLVVTLLNGIINIIKRKTVKWH